MRTGDIGGVISTLGVGSKHYNDVGPSATIDLNTRMQYRTIPRRSVQAPHSRSTKYMTGCHDDENECLSGDHPGNNVALNVSDGSTHDDWFVMYYLRLDPLFPLVQSGQNYKWVNWEPTSPYTCYQYPNNYSVMNGCGINGKSPGCDLSYVRPSGGSDLQFLNASNCGNATSVPVVTGSTSVHNEFRQWVHTEQRLDTSGDLYQYLHDNVAVIDTNLDVEHDCAVTFRGGTGIPGGVTMGGFWRKAMCGGTLADHDDNACRYFDDVYVDTTLSRVVLGNAPTYTACTKVEPQPPITWAPTNIVVTINLGSFTDDDPVYVFVFDSTNVSNVVGEPIVTGGCITGTDCADAEPCTDDVCTLGVCSNPDNTDSCDADGLWCTTPDTCAGGTCVAGAARNCADSDACTTDTCNDSLDACAHAYGGTTVHLDTGDLVMNETGTTTGTAIITCEETPGTAGCCESLEVDFTLGGSASGGGIDYTSDRTSPVTME
jgi:hypothetical protein